MIEITRTYHMDGHADEFDKNKTSNITNNLTRVYRCAHLERKRFVANLYLSSRKSLTVFTDRI